MDLSLALRFGEDVFGGQNDSNYPPGVDSASENREAQEGAKIFVERGLLHGYSFCEQGLLSAIPSSLYASFLAV